MKGDFHVRFLGENGGGDASILTRRAMLERFVTLVVNRSEDNG